MHMNIADIRPAAWNPRSHATDVGLEELTASIQAHGVIQPIVVRNTARGVEVVAGSRRLTAAERAGLTEVPIITRELDDVAAAEVAMAENIQDEAMPPLDEAAGYQHLIERGQLPVNEVSRRLGVPISRVRRRLRLLELDDVVQEALAGGEITLAHADRLVRVPRERQSTAMSVCRWPSFWRKDKFEPAPVAQLDQWLGKHTATELDAPTIEDYLPELVDEEHTPEAIPTLLKLSTSLTVNADLEGTKHGIIGQGRWIRIGSRDHRGREVPDCEHATEGVIVHGTSAPPSIIRVCAKKGCPVHRPAASPRNTAAGAKTARAHGMTEWEKRQEREDLERRTWEAERPDIFAAFIQHVNGLPLSEQLLRDAAHLQRAEKLLTDVVPNYVLTMENMGQALAVKMVENEAWSRDGFKRASAAFGFAMPRRKTPRKAASAKAKKTTGRRARSAPKATQTEAKEPTAPPPAAVETEPAAAAV